jgi:hypothetical protein
MAGKSTHPEQSVKPDFTEIIETFGEISREWAERMKTEADLVSELMQKLTAARSFPETTTACGEWMSRRMELLAEDNSRLLADTQKFWKAGTRLMSSGLSGAAS